VVPGDHAAGGFGHTRTATRLPVLVMVTGHARWLAARLIPSRVAEVVVWSKHQAMLAGS
jgi:hypothetical protein